MGIPLYNPQSFQMVLIFGSIPPARSKTSHFIPSRFLSLSTFLFLLQISGRRAASSFPWAVVSAARRPGADSAALELLSQMSGFSSQCHIFRIKASARLRFSAKGSESRFKLNCDKISLRGPKANILHVFVCLPTCYLFPGEKEKKEYRVYLDTYCV